MVTSSFTDGSHCKLHLYINRVFFAKTFLYTQKAKKINHFFVRCIFLNPKYRELFEQ